MNFGERGAGVRRMNGDRGQGTVEAAVVIPILFLLILILLQPGIVLYDLLVMKNAVAEGCRLMATTDEVDVRQCEEFIAHRLSAIPQHDLFHAHGSSCYAIQIDGGADKGYVEIWVDNELKPLPLVGAALDALGVTNGRGNIMITEGMAAAVQPSWVTRGPLGGPADWVEDW